MTALYQQVSDNILRLVQSGTLKIGDKLPPEAEYAAELGVSRSTLRLAFAELERVGVLMRKKRVGTKVIANHPKRNFSMSTTGLHELLSLGRDTELTIKGTRTVTPQDMPILHYLDNADGPWLEIEGARTLPGESAAFNVTQIYVPQRYFGIEHVLKAKETSVFKVIEQVFDISVGRVSQAAKAIACPEKVAHVIGLKPGAPALQILAHLYSRDGTLMEISVATFDPERFQLRTDVTID